MQVFDPPATFVWPLHTDAVSSPQEAFPRGFVQKQVQSISQQTLLLVLVQYITPSLPKIGSLTLWHGIDEIPYNTVADPDTSTWSRQL